MKAHPPDGFADIPKRLLKAMLDTELTDTSLALLGVINASAFSGTRYGVALMTRAQLIAWLGHTRSKSSIYKAFRQLEETGFLVEDSDPPAIQKQHIP